jgi:hypothetical protein
VLMVEAITFNLLFYGQFFKRLGSAAGWPDVFVKKSPNDNKKSPKKSPNQFFLKFSAY